MPRLRLATTLERSFSRSEFWLVNERRSTSVGYQTLYQDRHNLKIYSGFRGIGRGAVYHAILSITIEYAFQVVAEVIRKNWEIYSRPGISHLVVRINLVEVFTCEMLARVDTASFQTV